jgi:hypothetical protein
MTLTLFELLFAVTAIATVGLAVYRKWGLAMHEDGFVHIDEAEGRLIPQQVAIIKKIHAVDVVGKTLTVLTTVLGIVLMVAWGYQQLGHY